MSRYSRLVRDIQVLSASFSKQRSYIIRNEIQYQRNVINIRTDDPSFINHFENETGRSFSSSVDSPRRFRSRTRARTACMLTVRHTCDPRYYESHWRNETLGLTHPGCITHADDHILDQCDQRSRSSRII